MLGSGSKRSFDGYGESQDSKRQKGFEAPSPVLLLRNLPSDVRDEELTALAMPFGGLVKQLRLVGKNQAFIQLPDVECSQRMMTYHQVLPATIRGSTIYLHYSNRTEITASESSSSAGDTNSILLINIANVTYPINADIMYQVCSKFGVVQKVVLFLKNNELQSLVQFADVMSATAAKQGLEGQCIYTGCCQLHVQFSKLSEVKITSNGERSRDYTNPSLPASRLAAPMPTASGLLPLMGGGIPSGAGPSVPGMPVMPGSAGASPVLLVNNLPDEANPDNLFVLFGVFGDVMRVKMLHNKKGSALIQFRDYPQAMTAFTNLNGISFLGKNLTIYQSKNPEVSMPRQEDDQAKTKDFSQAPTHRFKIAGSKNFQHINPVSDTLFCSGIHPSITEHILMETLAPYEPVSVKFVPQKVNPPPKHMANIKFKSVDHAMRALLVLDNADLAEQKIRVTFGRSDTAPVALPTAPVVPLTMIAFPPTGM